MPPLWWFMQALPVWALSLAFAGAGITYGTIYAWPAAATVLVLLAFFAFWLGMPPAGSFDHDAYSRALAQYTEDMALYEQLWMCGDCGVIFKP